MFFQEQHVAVAKRVDRQRLDVAKAKSTVSPIAFGAMDHTGRTAGILLVGCTGRHIEG